MKRAKIFVGYCGVYPDLYECGHNYTGVLLEQEVTMEESENNTMDYISSRSELALIGETLGLVFETKGTETLGLVSISLQF